MRRLRQFLALLLLWLLPSSAFAAGTVVYQGGTGTQIWPYAVTISGLLTAQAGLTVSGGQVLVPNGSAAAPSISTPHNASTGFYSIAGGVWGFSSGGTAIMRLGSTVDFATSTVFQWSSTADPSGTKDLILARDAANTLAQRNGTNAQAFNLYNTWTDASNYERGFMRFTSNILRIGAESAGTGTARNTEIIGGTGTTSTLVLQSTSGVGTTGADIIFKVGNNGATEAGRFNNAGLLTLLNGLTMSAQSLIVGSISLSGSSDEINFGGGTITGVSGNLRTSSSLLIGAPSGGPASLLDLRAGDLTFSGANGQKYVQGRATELVAVGSGISTKATTIQIPADAIVYAVPVYVKTKPGGTATMTVTATTSGTAFQKGANISTNAGTSDPGTKNTPINYNAVAAQTVTFTFDVPTTDALGEIRVDLYYSTSTPPTS